MGQPNQTTRSDEISIFPIFSFYTKKHWKKHTPWKNSHPGRCSTVSVVSPAVIITQSALKPPRSIGSSATSSSTINDTQKRWAYHPAVCPPIPAATSFGDSRVRSSERLANAKYPHMLFAAALRDHERLLDQDRNLPDQSFHLSM